jgi:hypothetical protein
MSIASIPPPLVVAVLATVGTGNKEIPVATLVEGAVTVWGSLVVGIPIGLALAL